VIAAVDLIGLRFGEVERIFLADRKHQIRVRVVLLAGGLALLAGGLMRLLPV
jgi:hypothetical protein